VFFWNDFPFVKHTPNVVETTLASQMMDFLLAFAETGDPTSRGVPSPSYVVATDPYVRFDQNITTASMFRSAECDFWDALSDAQ
jgi:hypothetical protein